MAQSLLFKLEPCQINGNMSKWIDNYLYYKVQSLGYYQFKFWTYNCRIHTRFYFGSFLFLLYINDISNNKEFLFHRGLGGWMVNFFYSLPTPNPWTEMLCKKTRTTTLYMYFLFSRTKQWVYVRVSKSGSNAYFFFNK